MMKSNPHLSADRQILTVSQLNRLSKQLLEDCFASIWLEGEISNLARPSSGHWYFSLKDERAQVRCAMFRSRNMLVRFRPEVGQKVLVRGKVSLYEGRGEYQLIVDELEPSGHGALALAFEQLKQKLFSEGLFEASRKQPLPKVAQHIAVITSPTGAAIHDILTTLERRFPSIEVTLLPVQVQGEGAAQQIASAIQTANRLADEGRHPFDVILCGRGGGSLEDLWAFNEEVVARAIANSQLPVVSAVGHEVDTTIADLVADQRAATPTAAAELLSPDQQQMRLRLASYQQALQSQLKQQIRQHRQRVAWLEKQLQHPGQRLQNQAQRLDELELRLHRATRLNQRQLQQKLSITEQRLHRFSPASRVNQAKSRLAQLQQQLQQQMAHQLERKKHRLANSAQLLNAVSPLATLERGYSITTDQNGRSLQDSTAVTSGDSIHIRLHRGSLSAQVTATQPEPTE